VIDGTPGIAFIADPWGNVYELLREEKPTVP
jgi:hypothetical protein